MRKMSRAGRRVRNAGARRTALRGISSGMRRIGLRAEPGSGRRSRAFGSCGRGRQTVCQASRQGLKTSTGSEDGRRTRNRLVDFRTCSFAAQASQKRGSAFLIGVCVSLHLSRTTPARVGPLRHLDRRRISFSAARLDGRIIEWNGADVYTVTTGEYEVQYLVMQETLNGFPIDVSN